MIDPLPSPSPTAAHPQQIQALAPGASVISWWTGTLLMRLRAASRRPYLSSQVCASEREAGADVTTEVEVMGPPRQRPERNPLQTGAVATSQGRRQMPEAGPTRERLSPHSPQKTQTCRPLPLGPSLPKLTSDCRLPELTRMNVSSEHLAEGRRSPQSRCS